MDEKTRAFLQFVNSDLLTIEGEQWRPVNDILFCNAYEVSNYGRIRRTAPGMATRKGKMLIPNLDTSKYFKVTLNYLGERRNLLVHRIVALTFIPNPDQLPQVNHVNGNKYDNEADNLEWCTSRQNTLHFFYLPGKVNGQAKLNPELVAFLKVLHNEGVPQKELAELTGMSRPAISNIFNGKAWTEVI